MLEPLEVDEESTDAYDEGTDEIEIRPEYDETKQAPDLSEQEVEVCQVNTDCANHPFLVCEERICRHKGIFPIY